MDQVHGVVHGPGPWGGPWTPVYILYTSERQGRTLIFGVPAARSSETLSSLMPVALRLAGMENDNSRLAPGYWQEFLKLLRISGWCLYS